jgi:single-strand DNA-binding protein
MSTINKVQLTGNLGANPEIKIFENGNKVARFSVATKEEYTTKTGEKSSDLQWHFVTAWGKMADMVETELQKGSFVSVEGRLSTRSYIDKNGQKRYATEIVANEVVHHQKTTS